MPRGGKREGAGRKTRVQEEAYLDAVKAGASLKDVTEATRKVLERAKANGDPKALIAVLGFLVSAKQETNGDITIRIVRDQRNNDKTTDAAPPTATDS